MTVQLMLRGFPSPRDQRGLTSTAAGAERLLAELVTRGLRTDRFVQAARLCLELEHQAAEHAAAGLQEAS